MEGRNDVVEASVFFFCLKFDFKKKKLFFFVAVVAVFEATIRAAIVMDSPPIRPYHDDLDALDSIGR